MQVGGRVGGEADDVAGVRRNFRVDEDDGEHRSLRSMERQAYARASHRSTRRSYATCARRPSTRRRRRRRASACAWPRRAWRRWSSRRRRARCARRERRRARQTRRGRCAHVPSTAAPPAASCRRRAQAAPSAASRPRAPTRGAISRAWLNPRSRCRDGASGNATTRSGRAVVGRVGDRCRATALRQRRARPIGEGETASVFQLLQQPVDRKRVDERRDGARPRRRTRETRAADRARGRRERADRARAAIGAASRRRTPRTEVRSRTGDAQFAALRQTPARRACASSKAVKCFGASI